MFKKTGTILILSVVLLAGVALAQTPLNPYLPYYWIKGTVTSKETGQVMPNRTVVFFKDEVGYFEDKLVSTETDAQGKYEINACELLYYHNEPIILGTEQYMIGVPSTPTNDYGTVETITLLNSQGYTEKDLVLIEGGWTLTKEGVPLYITRDFSNFNINITWEAGKYPNATIYVLTGDGTGQYTESTTSWVAYNDPSIASEFNAGNIGTGVLVHKGQVGGGYKEAYYKAILSANKDDLLNAHAVGKLLISLQGSSTTKGKNLVSVPFDPQPGKTVAQAFGQGSGSGWADGDLIQTKISGSPAYLTAVYTSNQWRDAATPSQAPAFDIDFRFGNWVITSANKTLTVVGDVVATDQDVAVYSGAGLPTGGKSLLGMIYPVKMGLAATTLIADGAKEGDLIQYKKTPLAPQYISAVVSGGAWKNAADVNQALDADIATLKLPYSYTYVRYGSTGFTWHRVKPY